MAQSLVSPGQQTKVRTLTSAYLRLTADISSFTAGAALGGAWAAESGFINTIQQNSSGPSFNLIANRLYALEMYPYFTGIGDSEYNFWSWATTGGTILPASTMGGCVYQGAGGREEMSAVIRSTYRPPTDVAVTIWTSTVSGTFTLSGESSSRSTSLFVCELPRWTL